MQVCVVKTHFADDIRRINFPSNGLFEDFYRIVKQLYSISQNEHLLLHYIDDEGDLISITTDGELYEAMLQAKSILRVFVTKKPKMDEKAPLFHSWVMLNSLVQSNSPQIPEEKCKEAIKEVEKISTQVRTCEQLLHTPTTDPDSPDTTNKIQTPTGNEPEAKMSIKDIVQSLSKEIAKNLIETSERIAKLIDSSLSTEPEIAAEINETAGAIIKILGECSEYSNETLADVNSSSDTTLQSVNAYSDNISALLASLEKDESIATLREETIAICNSLSSSTVSQCLSDSENIRDIIMST